MFFYNDVFTMFSGKPMGTVYNKELPLLASFILLKSDLFYIFRAVFYNHK